VKAEAIVPKLVPVRDGVVMVSGSTFTVVGSLTAEAADPPPLTFASLTTGEAALTATLTVVVITG
jgi:hypothetical protein